MHCYSNGTEKKSAEVLELQLYGPQSLNFLTYMLGFVSCQISAIAVLH